MESVNDVSYKQGAVTELNVDENVSVGNIYRRLCNACGGSTIDRGTVGRWAKRVAASEI
jgi:hypothetical protein